jgi:hypothetical protein
VGTVVFLLALSAIWPLPLVNVIPGAVIVLIAIAYLQEDGLLLAVAAAAAFLSLAGLRMDIVDVGRSRDAVDWAFVVDRKARRRRDRHRCLERAVLESYIGETAREVSKWRASSSPVRPTVWEKWPPSF